LSLNNSAIARKHPDAALEKIVLLLQLADLGCPLLAIAMFQPQNVLQRPVKMKGNKGYLRLPLLRGVA